VLELHILRSEQEKPKRITEQKAGEQASAQSRKETAPQAKA